MLPTRGALRDIDVRFPPCAVRRKRSIGQANPARQPESRVGLRARRDKPEAAGEGPEHSSYSKLVAREFRVKTVLIICPTHRDAREIAALPNAAEYRLLFHDYASIELEEMVAPAPRPTTITPVLDEVERIVSKAVAAAVDAVVSTDDYPGSTLAAVVAGRLGLPGTPVKADLLCQHKYRSRLIQLKAHPDAVPAFELLEPGAMPKLQFPFFIKPVKSFFSVGAFQIDDAEALRELAPRASLPAAFFQPLDALLERFAGVSSTGSSVLAEGFLTGSQVTFEGYAFEARVYPVGVVDSIMYPGTLAFERFDYPSGLPQVVQDRMAETAARVMSATGFTHGLFNIEFRYDAEHDRLGIVEINPRMASQFADLYEKVDGFSTYSLLLDLALGRRPAMVRGAGRHAAASSCVLRRFEDGLVMKCPSEDELERVREAHPDVRIEVLATPGERLSEQLQDGCSFRYGIISIGGRSREDVLAIFDWCRQRLRVTFEEAAVAELAGAGTRRG